MTTDPHVHRRYGSRLNVAVLTLMVAGVSLGYAFADLAEGASSSPKLALVFRLLALAGALGSLLLYYARFVEPSWIAVTKRNVPFPIADIRVAVVGDFHVGPHKQHRFIERVAAKVNALKPDIVLLVGDFLFDHLADPEHLRPLRSLRAPLGVFAVVGNHDSGHDHLPGLGVTRHPDRSADIVAVLEPLGIRFLRNASATLQYREHRFALAGIDDLWMDSCDVRKALAGVPAGAPTILLSHQPDIILDPASHRASLIVAGHTHGGQVRLPWYGSLSRIPQRLSKKFDRGIIAVGDGTTLAITHGIGETFLPLRFCARPEILLLRTV